jgi:hypothetical protein
MTLFQGDSAAFKGMSLLRAAVAVENAVSDPNETVETVEKFKLYCGLCCRLLQRAGNTATVENLGWLMSGLLSDVQRSIACPAGAAGGQQLSTADSNSIATFHALTEAVLQVLNCYKTGPQLAALVASAVVWIGNLPGNALALLHAACSSIAAIPEMAQLVEACIVEHACHVDSVLGPSTSCWTDVAATLTIPTLMYDEFIAATIAHQLPLTLHVHVLQLLRQTKAPADRIAVMSSAAIWISQMQAVPEKRVEARSILLWEQVLSLTEDANGGKGVPEADDVQEAMLKVLAQTADARASGGFLGAFGLGNYLHTLEFRLFCRTIAAAIGARQLTGADSSGTQKAKRISKLVQGLDALKKELSKKKDKAGLRRIEEATAFSGTTLLSELIRRMVGVFFDDIPELAVLRVTIL